MKALIDTPPRGQAASLFPAGLPEASPKTGALLDGFDWAASPLGPVAGWPPSLRIAVSICMHSRFPMFVWWGDALINVYNDAYVSILGQRHPSAFGQPARATWDDIWPVVGPQAEGVMREGYATLNERVRLVMERNGFPEETWFTWSYSPIADEHGGIGGLFCACTEDTGWVLAERERDALLQAASEDVALRQRAARRDHFVITLDEAVRALSDPAQITATCARLLCEHLDTHRCAYAEVLDDEDTFDVTGDHNRGVPSIVGRYCFADFGPEVLQLMRDGQPFVADDVEHHEPAIADLSVYRQTDIRAVICVPLRKNGRLVAAMAVHHAQPRHWLDDEIELVLHVTDRCLDSIEHARAQRRLRESEARFRAASVLAASIVWTNDASGRMLGDQPGWQSFTGQSLDECQGYGWANAVHPDDAADTITAWNEAVAKRGEFVHRHRVRRADGEYRICDIRALPLADPGNEVREWVGVHTDITERLRFEDTLQESEMRFRSLSDSAPVMIWVTRADGQCEYLNRGWFQFTGQTPAEALGHGWLEALHPEDAGAAEEQFMAANRAGTSVRIEYRLRRHDGVYRWCLDTAVPRSGPDGQALGFIGSVIDITERKRTETALTSEKRVLQLIATGSPMADALAAIVSNVESQADDAIHCAVLCRNSARNTLHVVSAPHLPDGHFDALDGTPVSGAWGVAGLAVERREMVWADDAYRNPPGDRDGRSASAEAAASCVANDPPGAFAVPILGAGGSVIGSVAAYYRAQREPDPQHIDAVMAATHLAGIVLEKHALDEQLNESLQAEQAARAEAERASRMKDEFLATLSHELRTPLSAILGWVTLLRRRGELSADVERGVTVIERNARAQSQIIADLLDMSAIMSGKLRLELQTVDIENLVALAVETLRPTAVGKGISIGYAQDTRLPAEVMGDAGRVQQILWNLLSNAVKFTPSGGRVEVRLSLQGPDVVLHISDNGEGIAPEFMPFLFDRFRQADASTTRSQGGLGLGLSIVKKLVDLHGGSIVARSDGALKGATFELRLPRTEDRDLKSRYGAQAIDTAAAGRPPLAAPAALAAHTLQGLQVLLVDDDQDGRDTTQLLLEQKDIVVTTAASAAEALDHLRAARFDAMISDIGMPVVDGYRLMQRVRALDGVASADIAAVALTAYARPEDRIKAIAAGFDRHLAKPVDPARLFSALAGAVLERGRRGDG